jgi:hypothetical protein
MQEYWQTDKLKCPSCRGAVKTVHPYYTAGDRWSELNGMYRWVTAFLGLLGTLISWFSFRHKALEAPLYECPKCKITFSFNDAYNKKENET